MEGIAVKTVVTDRNYQIFSMAFILSLNITFIIDSDALVTRI
jgi:hypothetical protein